MRFAIVMPIVVQARVQEANAKETWLPSVHRLERRVHKTPIVAVGFVLVAFAPTNAARGVRRVRLMLTAARVNAAMALAAKQAVLLRVSYVFRMPIVVRILATRGVEFAAQVGVMPKGCPAPRMGIVVRGFCATPRTNCAPRYRVRNMVIRVQRTGIVAVCIATDRVNARRMAPRVRNLKATNVVPAFATMGHVPIVVRQVRFAAVMPSVVPALVTTALVAMSGVRTACVRSVLL